MTDPAGQPAPQAAAVPPSADGAAAPPSGAPAVPASAPASVTPEAWPSPPPSVLAQPGSEPTRVPSFRRIHMPAQADHERALITQVITLAFADFTASLFCMLVALGASYEPWLAGLWMAFAVPLGVAGLLTAVRWDRARELILATHRMLLLATLLLMMIVAVAPLALNTSIAHREQAIGFLALSAGVFLFLAWLASKLPDPQRRLGPAEEDTGIQEDGRPADWDEGREP